MAFLISDGINKYTVPFDLIGEHVDVRITSDAVEVFFHGNRVASHVRRKKAEHDPVRVKEHMPPEHQKYLSYAPDEFLDWAAMVGPNTQKVVEFFLSSGKEPEQGFKYCVSLMKSADRYSQERVEKACERLLFFTSQPSYRSIVTILKSGQDKLPIDRPTEDTSAPAKRSRGITRGVESFRNGGETSC